MYDVYYPLESAYPSTLATNVIKNCVNLNRTYSIIHYLIDSGSYNGDLVLWGACYRHSEACQRLALPHMRLFGAYQRL